MKQTDFNKNWMVKAGIETILESVLGGSGEKPAVVDLPHDALISRPRYAECKSGPGMAFFEGTDLTYIKKFRVEEAERDTVHYINFDGIYMDATVIVNNRTAFRHAYGYSPFTVRLDEFLDYGAENEIRVLVRGQAMPNARWYPGLGIYRNVRFLTGPLLHLKPDGIRVTTLDCDEALGSVRVETEVCNAYHRPFRGEVRFVLKDAAGKAVAEDRNRFYISANETVTLSTRLDVDQPALWDAEHPNLYTCEVKLADGENAGDEGEVTFGIRTVRADSRRGLRINGKETKLRGGCIHHDNALIGAVSVADAEMRKIALLKSGGFNAVRTAHNPPSRELLDACDRLGMYVMDEFTDIWTDSKAAYDFGKSFEAEWEQDVEDVVRRDYNHPSVIMWSVGNEIPETGDVVSDRWGRKLIEKFRSLDRSRLVTNGINVMVSVMGNLAEQLAKMAGGGTGGGINDMMFAGNDKEGGADLGSFMALGTSPWVMEQSQEAADMLDVVGYNYTADMYEIQHGMHPSRVFFGSETNAPAIDRNWEIVTRNPYVIGDFCWTGWDYLGEVGGGRLCLPEEHNGKFMADYPWICAYQAPFNLIGDRRPMSFWQETVWTGRGHQPYISVHNPARYGRKFVSNPYAWTDSLPTWSWAGCEGMATAVEIYADADEVELIVNGASLGRKPVGDDFRKFYCRFETPYAPGTLEAVTYVDGKEAGRQSLATAGPGTVLRLSADKTELRAGSNDLCHILVTLCDEAGTPDLLSGKKVTAKAEGAVLAGMGSGDPMTEESYQDSTHRFFDGKVLAVIKAGDVPGDAAVTFSCEGCPDAVVRLRVTG